LEGAFHEIKDMGRKRVFNIIRVGARVSGHSQEIYL
jgi:hypothetical protein